MKTKVIAAIMVMLFLTVSLCALPVLSQPLGMVSYWKFDEGSGTTASDYVDANDGTIYGASWTAGRVDDALSFDGIDDYVLVPDSPSLCPTDAITIEAWIKPEEMDWWWAKMIVIKGDSDYWDWDIPASSYELLVRNYPYGYYNVEFGADFDGGHIGYRTDTGPLTLHEWNHVVGTYDGSFVKIYVNNACVLEQPQSGKIRHSWHPNMTLQIGSFISTRPGYDSVCYFDGSIDEVAIYSRALTNEEIQQHYQDGLDGLGYCPTPEELTQNLIEDIEAWNLPKGTEKSLISPLNNALLLLNSGNEKAATQVLMAFIKLVEGLRNKKLTNEQADTLITEAQRIINTIQG